MVDDAKTVLKEAAKARADEIFNLAEAVGMRQSETVSDDDVRQIDPERAIWLVEGGANRTSVVRRQVAIDTLRRLYGEDDDLTGRIMYQFGSDRKVLPERNGKPNKEYGIAKEIAGEHLPEEEAEY